MKISLQPHDLAGSTREKHLTTLFQKLFRLLESFACPALYVFASPKCFQSLFSLSIIVDDIPILVKPCAKHYTILRENRFCQKSENATGGTGKTGFLIRIDGRINSDAPASLGFNQFGAGFLTFATINATCRIYLRIHKAFLILYKLNALQGTT